MIKNIRKELSLGTSIVDLIVAMSEGNPGGATVLANLSKETKGLFLILDLDDMNIRGSQIWIGYKDHCKQDLSVFIKAIEDHDPEMIETINKVGNLGNHAHKAVPSGASRPGERAFLGASL